MNGQPALEMYFTQAHELRLFDFMVRLYSALESCGYLGPADVVHLLGSRDSKLLTRGSGHLYLRNKWLLKRHVRIWPGHAKRRQVPTLFLGRHCRKRRV